MTSDISTPLSVVGMDGSAGGWESLQWAVAHAELSGAPVQAVMAWQRPEVYLNGVTGLEADARRELQTAVENALSPDQRSPVTSQVIATRPGHVLVDASATPSCSSSAATVKRRCRRTRPFLEQASG